MCAQSHVLAFASVDASLEFCEDCLLAWHQGGSGADEDNNGGGGGGADNGDVVEDTPDRAALEPLTHTESDADAAAAATAAAVAAAAPVPVAGLLGLRWAAAPSAGAADAVRRRQAAVEAAAALARADSEQGDERGDGSGGGGGGGGDGGGTSLGRMDAPLSPQRRYGGGGDTGAGAASGSAAARPTGAGAAAALYEEWAAEATARVFAELLSARDARRLSAFFQPVWRPPGAVLGRRGQRLDGFFFLVEGVLNEEIGENENENENERERERDYKDSSTAPA